MLPSSVVFTADPLPTIQLQHFKYHFCVIFINVKLLDASINMNVLLMLLFLQYLCHQNASKFGQNFIYQKNNKLHSITIQLQHVEYHYCVFIVKVKLQDVSINLKALLNYYFYNIHASKNISKFDKNLIFREKITNYIQLQHFKYHYCVFITKVK